LQGQSADNRKPGISFRIEPEIKAALENVARQDRRSVSSLIEKILADWLEAHGHLPKEDKP
jgi:hypothetical protein